MRVVRMGLVGFFGSAALLWQGVAAAAPSAPTDPTARDELKQGYTLAQDGKCDQAIPHLTESLKREPKAITLINLADCEEKVGKLADAIVHWGDARARAAGDGEKAIEAEATTRAAALDAKLPRLTIQVSKTAPADTTVERDGVLLGAPSLGVPLPVDPGPHTIIVRAKGHVDTTKTITVAEGEKQIVDLTAGPLEARSSATPSEIAGPPHEKEHRSMSLLVPIGFGVGAVGIVVGTITGIITLGKGSDAKTHCGTDKQCDSKGAYDDVQSGKTMGTVSTVAFIVGGAGVALGVVGLFSGKKTDAAAARSRPRLDLALGPTSMLLRGRF